LIIAPLLRRERQGQDFQWVKGRLSKAVGLTLHGWARHASRSRTAMSARSMATSDSSSSAGLNKRRSAPGTPTESQATVLALARALANTVHLAQVHSSVSEAPERGKVLDSSSPAHSSPTGGRPTVDARHQGPAAEALLLCVSSAIPVRTRTDNDGHIGRLLTQAPAETRREFDELGNSAT
jgi:hypothetical protein